MKLKTLIIDDEPLAHEILLEYLADLDFIEVVGHCYLASEALAVLNQQAVDLIFLDIQMPKLNGLDFVKILTIEPQVIITSAYQEYALASFELAVCDYLLKPFRYDRFLKAVNKAHKQHLLIVSPESTMTTVPTPDNADAVEYPSTVFIKVDKQLIQVAVATIDYLEAYGNYVKVWQSGKMLLTPRTLSSFEQQLDPSQFIRIHKSFIVHKHQILAIQGNQVQLRDQQILPLGKSFRHLAKQLAK